MDADDMCMEMRDIHIHTDRQTHARTLYTNTSMMMKIMRS